jgi:microcystin degradation protein MlrC
VGDAIAAAERSLPTTNGEEGPTVTVFSDAADATASGASGDSNKILEALLEHGFSGRALLPVVDAARTHTQSAVAW